MMRRHLKNSRRTKKMIVRKERLKSLRLIREKAMLVGRRLKEIDL
jgi:hypothetical protein